MKRDAVFYFANLGADVTRCVNAAKQGGGVRYENALSCAYRTLDELRKAGHPEAYEEALLMLRGLDLARAAPETLASFQSAIDALTGTFLTRLSSQ